MKLDKLLQSQGIGSRKYCQTLIKQGNVIIKENVCTDINYNIPESELNQFEYCIFGETYQYRKNVYIALNKPKGYECSHQPDYHHSVYELFPEYLNLRGIQTIGRLDQDTTGLLLLTDDGQFLQKMTHPRHHVGKSYQITTENQIQQHELIKFQQGISLRNETGLYYADELVYLNEYCFNMTIYQGIYHQVKRMVASIGHHVTQLHRFKIGALTLDELNIQQGEWCYLTEEQVHLAKSQNNTHTQL